MIMFDNVATKEINGKNVQIFLLPASAGITIAQKLSKIVLPVLGNVQSESGEVDLDFKAIAESIGSNLEDDELLSIIRRLLKDFAVDGAQQDFDKYFTANYGMLFSILAFALQENFGSFFDSMVTQDE